MVFIYILKLEEEKYYVGKTNSPQFRIDTHFDSGGSAWTKRYKPIEVFRIIPNCDDSDENKFTLFFMHQFGIDNVRGGSFSRMTLSKSEKKLIEQMNNGTHDKCFNCGQPGHWVKDCPSKNSRFTKAVPESNSSSTSSPTHGTVEAADAWFTSVSSLLCQIMAGVSG